MHRPKKHNNITKTKTNITTTTKQNETQRTIHQVQKQAKQTNKQINKKTYHTRNDKIIHNNDKTTQHIASEKTIKQQHIHMTTRQHQTKTKHKDPLPPKKTSKHTKQTQTQTKRQPTNIDNIIHNNGKTTKTTMH